MKSKGSILFEISKLLHCGTFSAKDLIEILKFMESKDKTLKEKLS